VASVVFTLIEATLGALLVKLGYTAQSQSPLRPAFLALHLANTLLLVAALTLTAHLLNRDRGYLRGSVRLRTPYAAVVGIFVVMIVGVTGSLAALGDTLFPASSLGLALAQDFSSASDWLVRWRWTHPGIAFAASFFLIWLMVRAAQHKTHADNRSLSALILLLLAAVYSLGLLDVLLLAPLWVQVAHLLAADSLWAALVVLTARLMLVPVETGNRE
jgi:cytochrome c oxidase assembly protein subunit 15